MRNLFVLFACFLFIHKVEAQQHSSIGDTIVNGKLLMLSYGVQLPGGDMADRFGWNNVAGGSFLLKTGADFLFGIEGDYIFGGTIKEDSILNGLETSSGDFVGQDGLSHPVILNERGFAVFAKAGKIIPVFNANPNSGLTLLGGVGLLQHKIRINDVDQALPQLSGDYLKGYDRLTNGLALKEGVSLTHLDEKKLINFNIGFEVVEAFTQNRRDWNFDEMKRDVTKRVDLLFGIRAAWILPFYGSTEETLYKY